MSVQGLWLDGIAGWRDRSGFMFENCKGRTLQPAPGWRIELTHSFWYLRCQHESPQRRAPLPASALCITLLEASLCSVSAADSPTPGILCAPMRPAGETA